MRQTWSRKKILSAFPQKYRCSNSLVSFGYLIFDLAAIVGLTMLYHFSLQFLSVFHPLITILYIYFTGIFFIALTVLAHECGHGAFCRPLWLQNTIGFLIHSFLLWPYWAWRETHRLHHRYTNNSSFDTVHLPGPAINSINIHIHPIVILILTPITFWLYLIFNIGGVGSRYKTKPFYKHNHFSASNPIFSGIKMKVKLDLVAVLSFFMASLIFCKIYGFDAVFIHYYGPILVMQFHLVAFTKMQHHDHSSTWLTVEEWTPEHGIKNTFDREFGPFNMLNRLTHHIMDSHVVHHIASSIPHYNAVKLTKTVQTIMGNDYKQIPRRLSFVLSYYKTLCIDHRRNKEKKKKELGL